MTEPGSPIALAGFARWCRAEIDAVLAADELPSLLFAYGPQFGDPVSVAWRLTEDAPSSGRPQQDELIDRVLPGWIEHTGASQVGLAVPFGRPRPGLILVVLDELEAIRERSYLDIGRLRVGEWEPVSSDLSFDAWQATLAVNAGWQELAKWRCRGCQSVCAGEAAVVPSPCDFCNSTAIEQVDLATPLRDPGPPWSPFVDGILALIDHGSP